MNILVTGATGFIGKNLIQSLLIDNNISVLVRPNSNLDGLESLNIFQFNDNHDEFVTYLIENKIDGIIHLASLFIAQHDSSNIKEIILSNIYLGTALLEASTKANVKWFLNTGTIWQNYISDSEEYCPVNLYAASKQAFIDIAKFYSETSAIKFVTLKLSDTYGQNDTRAKILTLFNRISISGEELSMSPGEQTIDILYIEDVVSGFMSLIKSLESDEDIAPEYVLLSIKRYTLIQLAEIFSRISEKTLNIKWGGRPYRNREVMTPWQKGIPLPNWSPTIDIEAGIKKYLNK